MKHLNEPESIFWMCHVAFFHINISEQRSQKTLIRWHFFLLLLDLFWSTVCFWEMHVLKMAASCEKQQELTAIMRLLRVLNLSPWVTSLLGWSHCNSQLTCITPLSFQNEHKTTDSHCFEVFTDTNSLIVLCSFPQGYPGLLWELSWICSTPTDALAFGVVNVPKII